MRKLLVLAVFTLFSIQAHANDYLAGISPDMQKVGSGEYYWKGLIHAYDIALYAPGGKFDVTKPYALQLDYKTNIYGKDIAEKTIEEMHKISPIDKARSDEWLLQMEKIFPDVDEQTSLASANIPDKGIIFYKNGIKIGEIDDTEFSKRFFEIWLGPKTSDNELRMELLGETK